MSNEKMQGTPWDILELWRGGFQWRIFLQCWKSLGKKH